MKDESWVFEGLDVAYKRELAGNDAYLQEFTPKSLQETACINRPGSKTSFPRGSQLSSRKGPLKDT